MAKKKNFSPFISYYDDSLLGYDEYCDKKKKKYKCSVCSTKLSSKDTLKTHILHKHIRLKPYKCDVCSKNFILERELRRHQLVHDDTTAFKCFCGVVFRNKSTLKYHQQKFHTPNIPLKCSVCWKIYKDKWRLKNHMQTSHFPQSFKCSFSSCKKIFFAKAYLHLHQLVHSKIRYECSVCKKKFKLQHYKDIHEKSHNGHRPFKCKECHKAYLTLSHLNSHWRKEHLQVRNFLCSACGKTFKTKFEVVSHERSHEDKVFLCDYCGFEALSRRLLNFHKKTHLNENSPANISNQTSNRNNTELQKKNIPHYVFNSAEKLSYRCLDCEKCFKTAVRANEHWRRYHLVKTNFRCFYCPKLFYGKLELSEHLKSSHKETNYKCEICPFTTQFRIALFSHNKKHKFLEKNYLLKENKKKEKEKKSINQKAVIIKKIQNGVSTSPKLSITKEKSSLVNQKEKNLSLKSGNHIELKVNNKNGSSSKPPTKIILSSINTHASRKATRSKKREKKQKQKVFDSLTSNSKMTFYGEEDYKGISDLFGETTLLPYLDVVDSKDYIKDSSQPLTNNNNNNNNNEAKKKTKNLQPRCNSKTFYNWSGFRADPKMTLNCTAASDFDDCELFEI